MSTEPADHEVGEVDLILRPGTTEDMAEVAELYIAARREALGQMPAVAHDDTDVRRWLAGLPATKEVWLAERDEITGFAVLDGDWLDALYVGPQHQGTGTGSLLLDLVKAQRPGGFGLWVFASNVTARTFYHRHGLVELEHTDGTANEEHSPDVRMAWPGLEPLGYLRGQIDEVDDEIALLLARRFALTAAIQGFKERPGQVGRDLVREGEIAARMAAHAPGLGERAIGRIMERVISESLDAYERGRD